MRICKNVLTMCDTCAKMTVPGDIRQKERIP